MYIYVHKYMYTYIYIYTCTYICTYQLAARRGHAKRHSRVKFVTNRLASLDMSDKYIYI